MTASRRRFRFSLRTLFVVVTLLCVVPGGWVAYQLRWIKQRHVMLDRLDVSTGFYYTNVPVPAADPPAPRLLWLFGEQGVRHIVVNVPGPQAPAGANRDDASLRARALFPEAVVFDYIPETPDKYLENPLKYRP
jgi:hypothetical protein